MHAGVEGAIASAAPDEEAMSNTTEGDVSRNDDNRWMRQGESEKSLRKAEEYLRIEKQRRGKDGHGQQNSSE